MRTKTSKSAPTAVLLLIFLLIASNASGRLVLCIGDNEHVAFESAYHRHCHDSSHKEQKGVNPSTEGVELFDESHHCKPCIDIPISMNSVKVTQPPNPVKQNKLSITSPPAQASTTGSMFVSIRTTNNLLTPACQFAFLNTIILLV